MGAKQPQFPTFLSLIYFRFGILLKTNSVGSTCSETCKHLFNLFLAPLSMEYSTCRLSVHIRIRNIFIRVKKGAALNISNLFYHFGSLQCHLLNKLSFIMQPDTYLPEFLFFIEKEAILSQVKTDDYIEGNGHLL